MKLRITIAGKTYEAEVEVVEDEERPLPPAQSAWDPAPVPAQNHDGTEKTCRSPLTGLVIRVHVEAGQAVEANQLLVVLEAMKMETQVRAPCAGVVEKVHAKPGNPVKMSQVLVELS